MIIKIFNKEKQEYLGEFKIRDNAKSSTINNKIKQFINQKYNSQIRRMLPTGKFDFATGQGDISYILFGENLPFKNIYFLKEKN